MIDNREVLPTKPGRAAGWPFVMQPLPLEWAGCAVRLPDVAAAFPVGVIGVLLDEIGERVLLVEHIFHTFRPWGLPGGWIARGEDPARTAEREYREETGLHVRAVTPTADPAHARTASSHGYCFPDGPGWRRADDTAQPGTAGLSLVFVR